MTNLEIIKLYADRSPALLSEFLDDIYCIAWNNGARDDVDDHIGFNEEWLESEYDRGWFRESDVEALL